MRGQTQIIIKLVTAVFVLAQFACGPKMNERAFPESKKIFGPDLHALNNLPSFDAVKFKMNWSMDLRSSDFFLLIRNLNRWGIDHHDVKSIAMAAELFEAFYHNSTLSGSVALSQTPYLKLLMAEAVPEVQNALTSTSSDIDHDMKALSDDLDQLSKSYNWPQLATLPQALDVINDFEATFMKSLPGLGLSSLVKEGLDSEVPPQFEEGTGELKTYFDDFHNSHQLSFTISRVNDLLVSFSYDADDDLKKLLDSATALATQIDGVNTDDTALRAVISVWFFLDDQERIEYIKPVSADLYDYFKGESDDNLKCMQAGTCGGFFQKIIQKYFIEPKIDDFGIQKIKDAINEKAARYAEYKIAAHVTDALKGLPARMVDRIQEKIKAGHDQIDGIGKDVPGFVKQKFLAWAQQNFPAKTTKIPTLEWSQLKVTRDDGGQFHVTKSPNAVPQQISTAGLVESMGTLSELLENVPWSDKDKRLYYFYMINKLLALGGAPLTGAQVLSGLTVPLRESKETFNVQSSISSDTPFGLYDNMMLKGGYTPVLPVKDKTFSSQNQALIAGGLVNLIAQLRDWTKGEFDRLMGNVTSVDIFGSQDTNSSPIKVFPKDRFFALTMGHLANQMATLTKDRPQIVFLSEKKQVLDLNMVLNDPELTVTMATVVDRTVNEVEQESSAYAVSLWIQTLDEAAQSFDGIESTKVDVLTQKDSNGSSLLDKLEKNMVLVNKLFMAFGNFLSSQMINNQGQVASTFNVDSLSPDMSRYSVRDQLSAIQALMIASQRTGLEPYRWTALQCFADLHEHFIANNQFFQTQPDGSDPRVILQALKVISMVAPYLPTPAKNYYMNLAGALSQQFVSKEALAGN